jgi:dihydroorotate dehydrogenase (NAD+) catalytic subunit
MNLATDFCGVKFPNPTVLASGVLGVTGDSMKYVIDSGAGAVTTKSTNVGGRVGHPNPIMITYEGGMMNAVGLSNPGIKEEIETIEEFKKQCENPLLLSVFAKTVDGYREVAEMADKSKADILEINISCPNVEDEFGKPFACCEGLPGEITKLIKGVTKKPIIIKLSPNVPNITNVCKEVEDAGADGLTLINTVGPGLAINIETSQPILANKVGGMSGPAIKPIAVKAVFDAYKAVKIPIIGLGGITTGRDAIEIMMAGAKLVGVGTAVYYHGAEVFKKITNEMEKWMKENDYSSLEEIVGLAHKES